MVEIIERASNVGIQAAVSVFETVTTPPRATEKQIRIKITDFIEQPKERNTWVDSEVTWKLAVGWLTWFPNLYIALPATYLGTLLQASVERNALSKTMTVSLCVFSRRPVPITLLEEVSVCLSVHYFFTRQKVFKTMFELDISTLKSCGLHCRVIECTILGQTGLELITASCYWVACEHG